MNEPVATEPRPPRPDRAGSFLVLLATHNGARWLEEQLLSIYSQDGVQVSVVASDDSSGDATPALLRAWTTQQPLELLESLTDRLGSANRNFLRLIRDAPLGEATHVALADQDDIWAKDKLLRASDRLSRSNADVYSSDVTAFWPDGHHRYIRKSHPIRPYDYLFESAGPGCTFVFRRETFERLKAWVMQRFHALQDAKVHDWLIYAYARKQGWRWIIDDLPTVLYRQHDSNELGANAGLRAALARLRNVLAGTYRRDVLEIANAVDDHSWVSEALARFSLSDRFRLAAAARELRRRGRDQAVLAVLLLVMRRT